MKRVLLFMGCILFIFLSGCQSTAPPQSASTAIPPPTDTLSPPSTFTPTPLSPTDTPTPTKTPLPTDTPVPTETPLPTDTPTPIPTEMPVPTDTPAPTLAPYAGPPRIVFSSNRQNPDKPGLAILYPETGEITLLETGIDANLFPRWSPDGNQVIFAEPDVWHLHAMMADGSQHRQITDFRSNNADWSPDGTRIVFQSDHQNEPEDTPDIYILNLLSGELAEILDDPPSTDFNPRWSPDGNRILFISNRTGNFEIFVMNVDGSEITQITKSKGQERSAEWSPDGSRIVFSYSPGGPVTDLYIINADGATESVVRLTADNAPDSSPSWSPDGSQIVFASRRSGNWDLWVVNADGSGLKQLTDDEFFDDYPHWGP